MTEIPEDHPRYHSLITRELIARGVESGITSINGLIAQGRGEAFDYLIGEITTASAREAQYAATAKLLLAKRPIISVNGNSAALVPYELVKLSILTGTPLEVNLFYRTEDRVSKIIKHLKAHGAQDVLGESLDAAIPGLSSERGKVCREGIYSADVVFVPLEDGDRCEALMSMGKQVIAVDLNPLSRTAQKATITIVDNITRAMPNMLEMVRELNKTPKKNLIDILDNFNNKIGLDDAIMSMCKKLKVSK